MISSPYFFLIVSGLCAGAVNGLLGAGGGMLLVPLLTASSCLQEDEVFPASVCIIFPLCIVSLCLSAWEPLPIPQTLAYLLGSILGGIVAGKWGKKVPTLWLHRILGCLILWGGVRNLC